MCINFAFRQGTYEIFITQTCFGFGHIESFKKHVQSYLNVLHFYACKLPLPTFLSFSLKSDSQKNLFAINVIKFALKYEI